MTGIFKTPTEYLPMIETGNSTKLMQLVTNGALELLHIGDAHSTDFFRLFFLLAYN
jgi:hypothetical protein